MANHSAIAGSQTDAKGVMKTIEIYDRGTYIETITKVEKPDGQVDIYVDKESK